MTTFKDNLGREWSVQIDVPTIRRVLRDTGFDLSQLFATERLQTLADDLCGFADILQSLVGPQLEYKELSGEDFQNALDGRTFEEATRALLFALVDFSPPSRRDTLVRAIETAFAAEQAALKVVADRIAQLSVNDLVHHAG